MKKNKITKVQLVVIKSLARHLPKDTYNTDANYMNPVNHFRRLRHAYESGGTEAMKKYVSKYAPKPEANA